MKIQQLGFSFTQCSSTRVGFGQECLSEEQCDNNGVSSILSWLSCSWFLPVFWAENSVEGTALFWCYWHNWECDERAEKDFTHWLPGMFPTPLQSLAEVYICTMELFWRKCSLNGCDVLYFSEIKWFRDHFEATTYIYMHIPSIQNWSGPTCVSLATSVWSRALLQAVNGLIWKAHCKVMFQIEAYSAKCNQSV